MVSSSWFRRHQKKVYIIMIFAMFVWGISFSVMEIIPKKPAGKILDRKISQEEFFDMLRRWQRLFFSQVKESIVPLVWRQFLYAEEAKHMGIEVTPKEIEEGIQGMAFQLFGEQAGKINPAVATQFLCNTLKLNPEQLERTLREAILARKLDSMIRMSVKVTTEELWQRYAMENEQVKFKVLPLYAEDFVDSVQMTEDEIMHFYEKYKDVEYMEGSAEPGYKLPERVKIECLIARYDDFAGLVSVTDDEMKQYYEDNKETQFKILHEKSDTAKDKLPEEGASPREKSKNGQSKESLKKEGTESGSKEIGTPVSYRPFDEVKEEIRTILARQKAQKKVNETISKVDEEIYDALDDIERPGFREFAEKYRIQYEIPKSKSTGDEFLTESDLYELFPGSDQIIQEVFERERHEPTMPLSFVEGKVILRVIDKLPPGPAPFEKIRDKVAEDLKLEKGLLKAKELAKRYTEASEDVSFDEIVSSIKREYPGKDIYVRETDYINRPVKVFNRESRYIEALQADLPNVAKAAFELKPGQIGIATEISGKKGCYIIKLIEKKPADRTTFEKEREDIKRRFLYEKQEAFLTQWQDNLNRHLEIYMKFQ